MAKMKIKAKEKDGIVRVKTKLSHEMMTYSQAKKKGIEANFITHVSAKVGGKTVYELSSSQFISENPILKFKFHDANSIFRLCIGIPSDPQAVKFNTSRRANGAGLYF